ncbi:hypothetical protein ANANG_G00204370 [Anguilla anguilla]|uniref:Uncharacterized protein n=1 Tax=Anguilla anguilla TaxID=7936 RepID=A0A9D3M0L4_ANGAN|nr:hypothetical protein ANANG_G00204370 [Anguilla anguilla]
MPGNRIYVVTYAGLWCGFVVAVDNMVKYQKYITVMQLALGVTAINKEERLPPKRKMWVTPSPLIPKMPQPPMIRNQGRPSLRRIKGRIHRSKSLDSVDLLDSNYGSGAAQPLQEQNARSGYEHITDRQRRRRLLSLFHFDVLVSWRRGALQLGPRGSDLRCGACLLRLTNFSYRGNKVMR